MPRLPQSASSPESPRSSHSPRSPGWRSALCLTVYSALWWLALPFALLRLWRRGRAEPGYRRHIPERLGFYGGVPVPAGPLIWLHAVSVGETRAAQPLVALLRERHPDHRILLTHMTPTGRATGRALFGGDPHVLQCYLPYDTGWMSARFLRRFAPRLGILMETEVWPNMVAQCERHDVPVALVNARLSARSLEKGMRLAALMRPAARALACVAAQTDGDAQRLMQFGARDVTVTGSVKFDVSPPPAMLDAGAALRQQLRQDGARPVLLCASTRDGEEAPILDAFRALPERPLLVLVPRHPQRFDEVAREIAARGLSVQRRTLLGAAALPEAVDVLLGDTMGEMFAYYAACDVAFIGGSLLPLGGQNLIEALAVGKPVLIGPHTFNFAAISEQAVEAGAASRVADAPAMLAAAQRLLYSPDELAARAGAARGFAHAHRGATLRTLALLSPYLARGADPVS